MTLVTYPSTVHHHLRLWLFQTSQLRQFLIPTLFSTPDVQRPTEKHVQHNINWWQVILKHSPLYQTDNRPCGQSYILKPKLSMKSFLLGVGVGWFKRSMPCQTLSPKLSMIFYLNQSKDWNLSNFVRFHEASSKHFYLKSKAVSDSTVENLSEPTILLRQI